MDDSHFNKNLPCSIVIKVTSDSPTEAELLQIALVPLNKFFEPSTTRMPLHIYMQPENPNLAKSTHDPYRRPRYDYPTHLLAREADIKACHHNGIDPDKAICMLEEWFDGLQLGKHKKLLPVGYGFGYTMSFIINWLGYRTYEDIFDWHYRDPFSIVSFDLDRKYVRNMEHNWRKLDMTSVLSCMGVGGSRQLDAMSQAVDQAKLYSKMLNNL